MPDERPYVIEQIRNSKYFILLLLFFLAMSLSLVIVGFSHLTECPAMVIVLRVNGLELDGDELTTAAVISSTALVSVLAGEMMSFFYMSPDFDPSSGKYCNKAFYNYTYYMNFVILATGILALLIHIPKCRFTFSNFYAVL
ncbi:hypothetical protein TNIN_395871 [Trichonephila inaurata madagascariensis]|uniref:Uncharacterized protein n=1 Tax=Trichonephila inaurata madagascariensis TaxID=2747483 RepID=A0A8X6IBW2_9ARAC|nr:hypothetical protein TNIN_395871 [Trichonephila inaurata madagascariensis]